MSSVRRSGIEYDLRHTEMSARLIRNCNRRRDKICEEKREENEKEKVNEESEN